MMKKKEERVARVAEPAAPELTEDEKCEAVRQEAKRIAVNKRIGLKE